MQVSKHVHKIAAEEPVAMLYSWHCGCHPFMSVIGCAGRLESFFGPVTVKKADGNGAKRKDAPATKGGKGKPAAKKGKAGGVGGKKK